MGQFSGGGEGGVGAAVTAALSDKGGQVFNVRAYGAKGDNATDDTSAVNAAITAAKLAGGIVFFPAGTYLLSSTISLGLAHSGLGFMGVGRYYNTVSGSVLKWNGAANGTMVQLDGCYYVRFGDLTLDGNSSAGIGLRLISSASSTASNRGDNLLFWNFTGTPGRGIEVGATAVANVSENRFDTISVRNTPTPFYQDGAQSFTWLDHFVSTNATDGINIRNGWVTFDHSEYGGTGNAIRIGTTGSKVYITDMDWEGSGTFLIVEDSTNYNFVSVNNLRALYDANGVPGTIIQLGPSAGACGTYDFTNCKFSTTFANSQATISAIQNTSGARLVYNDPGTVYLSSPSATVLSFSNAVYHAGGNDVLQTINGAPTGACTPGMVIDRTTGKLYVCENGSWVQK